MTTNYLNQFMTGAYGMGKEDLQIPEFNPLSPFSDYRYEPQQETSSHQEPPQQVPQQAPQPEPSRAASTLTAPTKRRNKGFWEGIRTTPGGADALINFGAGLMSSDNPMEGLSRGFQGVERAFQQGERAQAQEAHRKQQLLAKANKTQTSTWNKTGQQIRWIDAKGNEQLRGARLKDGEPYIQDTNGEWKPAHVVAKTTNWRYVNRSDEYDIEKRAAGIPNAIYYDDTTKTPVFSFKREGEQKAYGYALRAISAQRDLDKLYEGASPEVATGLTESLKRWASENSSEKISAAVLNDLIRDSLPQEQQAAGTRYLQAILRVDTGAAYTGTEIANYAAAFLPSAGDTSESLKSKRLARGLEALGVASRTGSAAPYLLGLIAGEHEMPTYYPSESATSSSKAQTKSTSKRRPLSSFRK